MMHLRPHFMTPQSMDFYAVEKGTFTLHLIESKRCLEPACPAFAYGSCPKKRVFMIYIIF